MTKLTEALLSALRALDTPTVCNALEIVAPERRGYGYTVSPLVCWSALPQKMIGSTTALRTIRGFFSASKEPA